MAEAAKRKNLIARHDSDWWLKEIGRSTKAWKTYRERGRKVVERYRDERDKGQQGKKFNILYSNTETLGPAVYSQPPVPDIRRRWQDKDDVGRLAATVLQRATQFCLESYDFDAVLDACKMDYLLPGFAVARVKYKPYFKKGQREGQDGKPEEFDESIVWHEAQSEYVPWDRFTMSRSKVYERVWWLAFGDDLTKDEVMELAGEEIANELSYSRKEEIDGEKEEEGEQTARVWEIWCKRDRKRGFVAEGFDGWILEPEDDPLRLEGFYPNAKPIWSITTNDTLKPIPEYLEYQDQALELDDLTERIDVLTSALRRRGVFDGRYKNMLAMLNGTGDNNFVPVDDWATLMEKGGLANVAMEMPLKGLVEAIVALDQRRESVKQIIYEVTGIADIVRGSSNPNETLGAQQIKGKWAGLRISVRQKKFANFARDLVRLKAEIIAERFDHETLSLVSGIKLPMAEEKAQAEQAMKQFEQVKGQHAQMAQQAQQAGQEPPPPPEPPIPPEQMEFFDQPTWEDVLKVLRSDKLRGFKIDIETDSTVQPDADAEKQARTELLTSLGGFAQSMTPAIQAGIVPKKLAIDAIQFALRSFKVGSNFEQELDSMSEQPEGPSPEQQQKEQELQAKEQELAQREAQVKDAEHKAELAGKDAKAAGDKLRYDEEVFAMRQKFAADLERVRTEYEGQFQQLIGSAEETVRGIVGDLQTGAAAPQPEGF
jgi:hypothetical protein